MTTGRLAGTYCITCTVNGTRYDGSSVNVRQRLDNHRSALRSGTHENTHLQRAWNKYGEEAFLFTPLDVSVGFTKADARQKEQLLLTYHRITGAQVFNKHPVAAGGAISGKPSPMKGRKQPKISAALRGHTPWNKGKRTALVARKRQGGWPDLIDPQGHQHSVTNLAEFCRVHSLNYGNTQGVLKGRRNHVKGWRLAVPIETRGSD